MNELEDDDMIGNKRKRSTTNEKEVELKNRFSPMQADQLSMASEKQTFSKNLKL